MTDGTAGLCGATLLAATLRRSLGGDATQPGASPAATEAPPAAPSDPAPRRDAAPDGDRPAGDAPGTTQPAPKPRISGFGSEPVFPQSGGYWQLPTGPGGAAEKVVGVHHADPVAQP